MKTKPESVSVADFLAAVEPPNRRADGLALCEFMNRVTGEAPVMWGPSIIGFGKYHYTYDSGHSGESCKVGFSPRKANLVLYINGCLDDDPDRVAALGKVKSGKSCLYVSKLADINLDVLAKMIVDSIAALDQRYPS
jgi:Domain of unknown function (DU1801)